MIDAMRKPGTDESNVQMSDVLCDFCHSEWTDQSPMVEGHQGSCICGKCLTIAFVEVIQQGNNTAPAGFKCVMCLEAGADREALRRRDEPGWQSPLYPDASICRRCIKQSAGVLQKEKEMGWTRPG